MCFKGVQKPLHIDTDKVYKDLGNDGTQTLTELVSLSG